MNENQLARKIAELFLASHDEISILEIEKLLLRYGHDKWAEGLHKGEEIANDVIHKTFKSESV